MGRVSCKRNHLVNSLPWFSVQVRHISQATLREVCLGRLSENLLNQAILFRSIGEYNYSHWTHVLETDLAEQFLSNRSSGYSFIRERQLRHAVPKEKAHDNVNISGSGKRE